MQIAQKLAGLHARRRGPLAARDGQEEARGDGQAEERLRRGREEERRRRERGRAHLRAARVLRRLRLQQEPLGGVRAHHVPDRLAEGALPGGAPLRDPHERQGPHREGRPHDRRRARDGHDRASARRQRERHRLQGRLHAPRRATAQARETRSGVQDAFGPADSLRPRGRARPRGRGARGGLRGAAATGRSAICSTWRRASTPSASTRRSSRRSCSAGRSTGPSRSAACRGRARFASIDIALERSRARRAATATPDRRRCSACSTRRPQAGCGRAPTAGDYVEREPWDRRELLVRERQSLGFYVSGHPLERYLKGDGRARASSGRLGRSRECAGMDDWAAGQGRRAWSRATASGSSRTAAARSRSSSSRT